MSNPTDEKNTNNATVQDEPHAPLAAQPHRGVDKQNTDPKNGKPEVAKYKADWLESLPNYEKGLIVSAIIIALLYVSFWSKWITDKPTEFFITSLLSFAVFLAVIVQAYVAKRQWHAMRQQQQIMTDALQHTKDAFEMVERPIVLVTQADTSPRLTENKPLRISISIMNKGRTAAQNIRVFFKTNYPGLSVGCFYPHPMDWNSVYELDLLPSGDPAGWLDAPANEFTISVDDYAEIANGRKIFVIHGTGRYEDLAAKRYLIAPFAYRFDPSHGFIPWSSYILNHPHNWPGDIDDNPERIEELIAERDELRERNATKDASSADEQGDQQG